MSRDALHQKHHHESSDWLQGHADAALRLITDIADRAQLSLPAREQYYDLICMELSCRADACRP